MEGIGQAWVPWGEVNDKTKGGRDSRPTDAWFQQKVNEAPKKGSEYFSGLAIMQLLIQQSFLRKCWSKINKKLIKNVYFLASLECLLKRIPHANI